MLKRIAILGDGQMALVTADALVERGLDVTIWGPFAEDIRQLADARQSPKRLPGFILPDEVAVTADPAAALKGAQLVISAVATQFIRSAWLRFAKLLPADVPVVSVSKGIENKTLLRPTQVIADVLGESEEQPSRGLCALSGPTIAAELARRMPATMVAASTDARLAQAVQDLLNVRWLRIYRGDDVIGVEVAGATKNVIALAAGMVDGLGAGDNAKSALLARGLAEIARLGVAMGAKLDTFFGVAGVGDLATTCFSPEGRNRSCGERLARGESLESILESSASIVEGVPTTKSVVELAQSRGVDMPIARAVHAILFEGMAPNDAIDQLMGRAPKAERIG